MQNISTEQLILGKNVFIHPTARIVGLNGNAKKIVIGDNSYIGQDVQIICDQFEIGDFSKIHHHTNIHGYKPCVIGHNAWIGQYCIIDSIGGVNIGSNFCLGANSHLWSHIKFGDQMEGCRFLESKELNIGNDVWIAGHCTITPVIVEDKSMVLAGSVVTKDLKFNTIYAGTPAESISHKIGFQFNEVKTEVKYDYLNSVLEKWDGNKSKIKIVTKDEEFNLDNDITYFNVNNRKYTKKGSNWEIEFMKYLLPEKAKFTPYEL